MITKDDIRWWEDSRRPCRDRPEYVDTTLVTGRGRRTVLKDMATACTYCPVLVQCRTEILVIGGRPPQGEVRAGVVYK